MFYRLVIAALLAAAVVIALAVPRDDDPEQRPEVVQRLTALEARIDVLVARLDQLEQRRQSGEPAPNPATERAGSERAVEWRLGPGLDGVPLTVAEQILDRRRGRVEVLLQIKAALPNAVDWPRQSGQDVPIRLTARDVTGAVVSDQSLTLLRGVSQEPGAYLHLTAELPSQSAHRVSLIDLRAE